MSRATARVIFSVAAGPRLGFGHLLRSRALAHALETPHAVLLRGGSAARRVARALGADLLEAPLAAAVARTGARAVVIDDPLASAARRRCAHARRLGLAVASVHDLGIAPVESDLGIDGSIVVRTLPARRTLSGPRYAVIAPGFGRGRSKRTHRSEQRPVVFVALGGGRREAFTCDLARVLAETRPDVTVRVAGGFVSRRPAMPSQVEWLPARAGLRQELESCSVAVVGGGVTLYETCACGTPTVAIAVVAGQRPTVSAFVRHRAVANGGAIGSLGMNAHVRLVAAQVGRLLDDRAARQRLALRAQSIVDGRGAVRVAGALRQLLAERVEGRG